MKKSILFIFLFITFFSVTDASASPFVKCYDIHPNCYQQIIGETVFEGDRHGDFKGNSVAILEDGSYWKIHPKDTDLFASWDLGDVVRIGYRTSSYWFKREHKYHMYNVTKKEEARVMLIQHQGEPQELRVVTKRNVSGVDDLVYYLKEHRIAMWPTRNSINFSWKGDHNYFHYSHVFCIVTLSDGSMWLLITKHSNLKLTSKVYVGTQNGARIYDQGENFYINKPPFDFFFISGTQREAWSCRAYPLFPR